jgi:site-specific recombinase XerD
MGTEVAAWKAGGDGIDTTVSDTVLSRIAASVAENTRQAYANDWRRFDAWCAVHGRTALPCTAETLAEYASALADQERAPASIMRAVSSVRVIHKLSGHCPPDTLAARAVVKAYRNERADAGIPNERVAMALSVKHLRKIARKLDISKPRDLRDCLVIVLGWAMMARREDLVRLNIADVAEVDDGLDVVIRKAKRDQMAVGRQVAVPYGSDPATCPVRLMRAWLAVLAGRGITEGPLFRHIDARGRIGGTPGEPARSGTGSRDGRMTGAGIWRIVKLAATRAGIDAPGVQAHSLRAGGATGAYLGGADIVEIGRHGGWHDGSPVLLRYIRDVDRWKKNPMHGAGL